MKSKQTKLTVAFLLAGVIGFYAMAKQPQTPTKEYTVTLSLQDWQGVLYSISNPDDVTKNQKNSLAEKIAQQVQKQIAADTTKPKK